MPPRLGAHMSIAGGLDRAVERAVRCGCEALQVFTKSSNQWAARSLPADEVSRFREQVEAAALQPVLAHDSYLINVGSSDGALWKKSVGALLVEFDRCQQLGIPYLVMHPGSHVGAGESIGLDNIARGIDDVHRSRPAGSVMILLENTAGQGSNLGYRFEQLRAILDRIDAPDRVGVCLDTAHLYAAGYDIGTRDGWERAWEDFDAIVGAERLKAWHVNDSKTTLGSRVDRHAHIGFGAIPWAAFMRLMNEKRFDGLPASLETPKTETGFEDEQNLAVLRRLVGRRRAPSAAEATRWREAARSRAASDPRRAAPHRPSDRSAR
ncbi:MAG: deoxyribonuclease IV [Acidobacteriota bacterium]|nr:MAG: deoxyribonuclease IV [Acidobacteriota bacterium]